MKKENKYFIGIGVVAFLVSITLQIFWSGIDTIWVNRITSFLTTVGIVFIALGMVRHIIYKERHAEDERTKKIGAFTLAYSWTATIVLVGVILWLDHYNILKMTVMQALGLTMFVMIAVAVVSELYLKRKGDIE